MGESFELSCASHGDTKWFRKSNKGYYIISRSTTLTVQHVTLQNAGEYICYGLSGTSVEHFLDVVTVDIYGKLQLGTSLCILNITI